MNFIRLKKGLSVFILCLFSLPPAFSQNAATLDSVCSVISSHKVTEGSFVQEKRVSPTKRALKSSGTFILSGEGLYLQTLHPLQTAMGVTKESYISVSADGARTVIDTKDNAAFQGLADVITALLSGDKEELETYFAAEVTGSKEAWNLNLKAKDETVSSSVKTISLTGDKVNILSLSLINAADGSVTYTFTNHAYKEALSDGQKALFKK